MKIHFNELSLRQCCLTVGLKLHPHFHPLCCDFNNLTVPNHDHRHFSNISCKITRFSHMSSKTTRLSSSVNMKHGTKYLSKCDHIRMLQRCFHNKAVYAHLHGKWHLCWETSLTSSRLQKESKACCCYLDKDWQSLWSPDWPRSGKKACVYLSVCLSVCLSADLRTM